MQTTGNKLNVQSTVKQTKMLWSIHTANQRHTATRILPTEGSSEPQKQDMKDDTQGDTIHIKDGHIQPRTLWFRKVRKCAAEETEGGSPLAEGQHTRVTQGPRYQRPHCSIPGEVCKVLLVKQWTNTYAYS